MKTYIHEIGHFLGFTDKYVDVKNAEGKVVGSKSTIDNQSGVSWNTDVMSTNEVGKTTFSNMHYRDVANFWVNKFNEAKQSKAKTYNPETNTLNTTSRDKIDEDTTGN